MIYGMLFVRVLFIIPFFVTSVKSEDVANERKEFTFPYTEKSEQFLKRVSVKDGGLAGYFRRVGVEFKSDPVCVLDTENNVLVVETEHNSAVGVMRFMGEVERGYFLKPKPTPTEQASKKQLEILELEKEIESKLKSLKRQVNFVGKSLLIGQNSYNKGGVLRLQLKNTVRQLEVLNFTRKKIEFYDEVSKKVRVWDLASDGLKLQLYGDVPEGLSTSQELQMSRKISKLKGRLNVIGSRFIDRGAIYKKGDFYTVRVDGGSYRLKVDSVTKSKIVFLNEVSKKTITLKLRSPELEYPLIAE